MCAFKYNWHWSYTYLMRLVCLLQGFLHLCMLERISVKYLYRVRGHTLGCVHKRWWKTAGLNTQTFYLLPCKYLGNLKHYTVTLLGPKKGREKNLKSTLFSGRRVNSWCVAGTNLPFLVKNRHSSLITRKLGTGSEVIYWQLWSLDVVLTTFFPFLWATRLQVIWINTLAMFWAW